MWGNAIAQKGSNTRPHSGLHWSAAVGIHPGGHVPIAQPLRQAASVVMTCTLPNRSEIVHSSVWIACGGAPPICAAACALAPPRSDSAHAAAAATLTVAITWEGCGGAARVAGKRRGFSARATYAVRPGSAHARAEHMDICLFTRHLLIDRHDSNRNILSCTSALD